jgi:hypothetical protein
VKLECKRPTPELVQEYINKFDNDSELIAVENALLELFRRYPSNQSLPEILIKVATLNSLYATNIYATVKVANHILNKNIDAKLQQRSPELVDEIALVTIGNKTRRNYSFASKYCHWHQPEEFLIYDSYVERILWSYQNQDTFMMFRRSELQKYPRYKKIIEGFRAYYGLRQFNFRELDKFLWLYGKEIFSNQQ